MTTLERLSDDERGMSVLAPDGWKLLAGFDGTRLRLHFKIAPSRRVYVFDIFYGGLTAGLPTSMPAIDALQSFKPDASPRLVGEWACVEECEGDETFANGVRRTDGAFLNLYFHGPTNVLADIGGLAGLVRIAESAQGLRPRR